MGGVGWGGMGCVRVGFATLGCSRLLLTQIKTVTGVGVRTRSLVDCPCTVHTCMHDVSTNVCVLMSIIILPRPSENTIASDLCLVVRVGHT